MSPLPALAAGLGAGFAVAVQVGAVTLLLIDVALASGPRTAAAAGMGVATADLVFASLAAMLGGVAGTVLARHQTEIHLLAALTLSAIAIAGLVRLHRKRARASGEDSRPHSSRTAYARFLAITAANPLTVASFTAIAAASSFHDPLSSAAFAVGVGAGSAAWHLLLAVGAGHAARHIGTRARGALAVTGRLGVLALAVHLALSG